MGVGPGAADLLTLRAVRLISAARCVACIVNGRGQSRARTVVAEHLPPGAEQIEVPLDMGEGRQALDATYAAAAAAICERLAAGVDVCFLCLGDPLLFGSFGHLLAHLPHGCKVEVVPGISSIQTAAAHLQKPLAQLDGALRILSGRHDDDRLRAALHSPDNIAILKAGPHRGRILALLEETNRLDDANYMEDLGGPHQKIIENVRVLPRTPGPYFSLFIVKASAHP